MKGNSKSVMKILSSLMPRLDQFHMICHVFRDTPTVSRDAKKHIGRLVHECNFVCTNVITIESTNVMSITSTLLFLHFCTNVTLFARM